VKLLRTALLVLAAVGSSPWLTAQPLPRRDVPAPLQTWIPWALDGAEESLCPVAGEGRVCLWPGRLLLELDAAGGRFAQDFTADRPLFAPIPGGERQWPQDVRLDGQPAPVVEDDERPSVLLTPGSHRVEGRFRWSRLPDSLPLPGASALLDLTVSGKPVPFPRREQDGLLLLRAGGEAGEAVEEQLRLKVFRRLADDIPLWLETRVVFEVSGKARELRLAGLLVPGSTPVSVSGDLPARVDRGELRVQVRPGTFTVNALLRLQGKPAELRLGAGAPPWPAEETWVFQANERLRQVEVSGPSPVDPSRTELPEEWRRFPAFLMSRESALALRETRRGEPDAVPDQISLRRALWLDLDGRGFTAKDTFSGTLSRASRLNAAAPAVLGRVAVDGQDQLVTTDPATRLPGVELRRQPLQVQADSRIPRSGALPAVGWDTNVQGLGVVLHLPPGWRLFAAGGADHAPGAWFSRWTLFGFFFVLLVAGAVWKLEGPRWGALALLTLTLCAYETGEPRLVWLCLLGATAVLRVAPQGKLRTAARLWWGVSVVALVLVALPFFARQLRTGLFPAAETGPSFAMLDAVAARKVATVAEEPRDMAPPAAPAPQATPTAVGYLGKAEGRLEQNVLSKAMGSAPQLMRAYEQDPHAVIQTGAGVPEWSWASQSVDWSGPVAKEQRLRLYLLPPFANLLLAFLRVALVTLLAWVILRRSGAEPKPASHTAAATALLLSFLGASSVQAAPQEAPAQQAAPQQAAAPSPEVPETPSEALLRQLRERLTRRPPCSPNCLSTPLLTIAIVGAELRIEAEVHAGEAAAWALPGPAGTWTPRAVLVDRAPAALARLEDGFLHARLTPGVHRVEMAGPLPPVDSFTLQLPDRPRLVRGSAEGWRLDGIRDDGATDGSVQLTRVLKRAGAPEGAEGVYEPWFEVRRELAIGVAWTVETVVRRVTPPGLPAVLRVPLLKGMLATGDREVKDGEVLVTMGNDQTEARWSSVLTPSDEGPFELKASEGRPWSEVWVLACGTTWSCTATGLPPVSRLEGDRLVSEYRPWPGESLQLSFRRPAGVPGQSLTVDALTVDARPGLRLTDATLDVRVRASRAGTLALALPKGAEVQALTVNGAAKPMRPDGGALSVPVEGGQSQVSVRWREPRGVGLLTRAPRVSAGREAVNVVVVLRPPEGRWLLLTSGPRWGPSLLFWAELLVMLLAAALLARLPGSPLRTWEWLLLALGVAQLPLPVALLVAGWFLVLAWRERRPPEDRRAFNLSQVLLVVWTLGFLGCLYGAVWQGLLAQPDMGVSGFGSTAGELRWYTDRVASETPAAAFLSLPLWVYRVGMLLWSLWLAAGLVRWLPWAWRVFISGGAWRRRPPRPAPAPPPMPPPPPPPAAPAPI